MKKIMSILLAVSILLGMGSVPALAAASNYPIDTTLTGEHSFEAIDATTFPADYALKDVDTKVTVTSDGAGNKFLKISEPGGGQARIQSVDKPNFGLLKIKFDFKVEDTNGLSDGTYPNRRIIMAENFMSGAYFLNLWTDADFKNPYIATAYTNKNDVATTKKFETIAYELDKWYSFEAYVDPENGYFTVSLTNEAGTEEKITVTDAKTTTAFNVLQLIRIPSWNGYQNGVANAYIDNVKMQ